MYQLLIALGTGILGTLFGLLAGASGPLVRARRANVEWLREARAQLCDRYYTLVSGAAEGVRTWDEFDCIPASESYRELADAAAALELYCSPGLSQAAQLAVRRYRHWMIWDFTDDEILDFTIERLSQLGEEFLQEVQNVKRLIQAELLLDAVRGPDTLIA